MRNNGRNVGALALGVGTLVALTGCNAASNPTVVSATSGTASPVTASTSGSGPDATLGSRTTSSAAPSTPAASRTGELRNETTTVTVRTFNLAARTAVVLRAEAVSGAEYCVRKRLPSTSDECGVEVRIMSENQPHTVTLSPKATYFSDFDATSPDACHLNGGCPVTAAVFAERVTTGNSFVELTVVDGAVVRAQQIYMA